MDTDTPALSKIITLSSFELHQNGITAIGNPSFEDWLSCGKFIRQARGAVHFWIGDWLNYGENRWGERYSQALEETQFDYQTLRNDKWVASRIPPERRVTELSFSHHQEVANLDPEEQDNLLHTALDQNLTREAFRKLINKREFRAEPPKQEVSRQPDNSTQIQAITISGKELMDAINGLNFVAMPKNERDIILSFLKVIGRRIDGLLMEYED